MLWLKCTPRAVKHTSCIVRMTIYFCICYLPPQNSSGMLMPSVILTVLYMLLASPELIRHVDAVSYFDSLLERFYLYQNMGIVCISGDFNGRIGKLPDYIEGVDSLPKRTVLDYANNKHGDVLLEFLIRANLCVLNGRNSVCDDYTYVSSKGASVVDYSIVMHEQLELFNGFKVTRAREVVSKILVPDHSLLSWNIETFRVSHNSKTETEIIATCMKFRLKEIPLNFMNDEKAIRKMERLMALLEDEDICQFDLDNVYYKFVKF